MPIAPLQLSNANAEPKPAHHKMCLSPRDFLLIEPDTGELFEAFKANPYCNIPL